jgi:ribosomal-protein-alanine N-acetyltransferase
MPVVNARSAAEDGTCDWTFADMVADDLPEVVAIERASFPNPWTGPLFLQELQVGFSRTILARDASGAIAGYVCRWLVADEIHVLNVAVDPCRRGHGLGTALMRQVLDEARRGRMSAVTLEVRRSNQAGRRLYETLGFVEIAVRRDYYGRGEDALVLRLDRLGD